nr:hypothetical protein [Lachnospiraceae bacterium]
MKESPDSADKKRPAVLPLFLLLAGAGLLLAGLLSGQAQDVLMKAVRVCLECIGVG